MSRFNTRLTVQRHWRSKDCGSFTISRNLSMLTPRKAGFWSKLGRYFRKQFAASSPYAASIQLMKTSRCFCAAYSRGLQGPRDGLRVERVWKGLPAARSRATLSCDRWSMANHSGRVPASSAMPGSAPWKRRVLRRMEWPMKAASFSAVIPCNPRTSTWQPAFSRKLAVFTCGGKGKRAWPFSICQQKQHLNWLLVGGGGGGGGQLGLFFLILYFFIYKHKQNTQLGHINKDDRAWSLRHPADRRGGGGGGHLGLFFLFFSPSININRTLSLAMAINKNDSENSLYITQLTERGEVTWSFFPVFFLFSFPHL